MEEIDDEDSSTDDDEDDDNNVDEDDDDDENGDYENEWVSLIEDEYSDESLGDWAKLETMRSSHPMQFAKQMAQFVSDDPVDYMDQPPAGLAIQGVLRPVLNKYMDSQSNDEEANQNSEDDEEDLGVINGHKHEDDQDVDEGLQKDEVSGNGTSYYKLEIVKIHLISAHGNQEVAVIGMDNLRFDVRVCSGRQVQTLRFAFKKRVFLNHSFPHLKLPHAFVSRHEQIIPKDAIIRCVIGGYSWQVKTEKIGEYYCFTNGWNNVVKDVNLGATDFLVFRLVDKLTFKMVVYSPNGVEKDLPLKLINVENDEDEDDNEDEDEDDNEDDEDEDYNEDDEDEDYNEDDKDEDEDEDDDMDGDPLFTTVITTTNIHVPVSSEYSAERQLNNLLFPRISGKQQKQKEAHQTEL